MLYNNSGQKGRSTFVSCSLAEPQRLGAPLLGGLQPRAGCWCCQRVGQPTYRLQPWGCFAFPSLPPISPSCVPWLPSLPRSFPSEQVAEVLQAPYHCCRATSHAAFSGDGCLHDWSTERWAKEVKELNPVLLLPKAF